MQKNHRNKIVVLSSFVLMSVAIFTPIGALAGGGEVKWHQKISSEYGNFEDTLDNQDAFGKGTALGDLDGDGVVDLAVGVYGDDDIGIDHGAVWILFLDNDGTVKARQKISETQGNFTGTLEYRDWFGFSITSLGDLDGDAVIDIAVGAFGDDDEGPVTIS